MKRLILPILLLHIALMVNATTYYFSDKSGNDNRSTSEAQNPSTPWKSLGKLNSIMWLLRPGDQVLFKRGETFTGYIYATASGTSDQPIVFGAYGSGDNPEITGLSQLGNWTKVRNNVWEADFYPSVVQENMIVVNNQQAAIGRFPNTDASNGGYLTIDSHKGLSEITSKQLSGDPNWTGGDIVIRKNRWSLDRSHIGYHVGNTVGFDIGTTDAINDGFGFFIENHTNTLDRDFEWYYNPLRHKLQMYFSNDNPFTYDVKGSTVENLVSLPFRTGITFKNLSFTGANTYAFNLTNSNYITLYSCDIRYTGMNAVQGLSSWYFTAQYCDFAEINNNAINLYWYCSNTNISSNSFYNIGAVAGMGHSGNDSHHGIYLRGDNNMIEFNKLDNIGYNGIHFEGDYSTVQNNIVNTFGFVMDDCGGIYTGQGLGDNTQYNYKNIINNVVLNGIGAVNGTDNKSYIATNGIYLDDNTNHVTVSGNTVANCGQSGLFCHNSTYIFAHENTLYNNGKEQLLVVRSSNPISHVNIYNNILFSKTADQLVSRMESYYGYNNLPDLGWIDHNYYSRPIDDNYMFYDLYIENGQYYTAYENIDSWRDNFMIDGNSKTSPVTIPAFTYSSKSGTNLFPNGSFDQNAWWVSPWSPIGDVSVNWNPNKLDAGTLQVSARNYSESNSFYLTLPTDNSVTAGKDYLLSFSLEGAADNKQSVNAYLKQQDYPNGDLSTKQMVPIKSGRKEIQMAFKASNSSRVSIGFDMVKPKGMVWMDNVNLQEAQVNYTNPDDYLLFYYNTDQKPMHVSLPGGTYYDATGKKYQNNVELQPYTSVVLIKESASNVYTTSADAQSMTLQSNLVASNAASFTPASSTDLTLQVSNQSANATSYQVERSADATNFTAITETKPVTKATGSSPVSYTFNDATPNAGKNYYRVKQYDEKGNVIYSPMTMINNISFKLNPNPAKDVLHILFDQPVDAGDKLGKSIAIRTTSGATVQTSSLNIVGRTTRSDVNVSTLAPGMYVLSITAEGQTFSRKFIKQ